MLRPGNVSSADDWEEMLVPEIDRQQAEGRRVAFRADAAFDRRSTRGAAGTPLIFLEQGVGRVLSPSPFTPYM